jgi:hypothetical protein
MSFTFGSDPEFMLTHMGELKSAIGILPKKENPMIKNGHRFYFDNVLSEMAIKPASSKKEAIENTKDALQIMSSTILPCKISIKASGNYSKKDINCPDARIAGCDPEWDVYTLQCLFPPDSEVDMIDGHYQFKTPFRSAGGHIHIGSESLQDPMEIFSAIRMMDLFIGIPSLFLDHDETSKDRRKIYGHAGSHRVPDHGLEYRVLGNFWFSSPDLFSLIYDLSEFVMNFVSEKTHERLWSVDEDMLEEDPIEAYTCFGYDVNLLQKAINTCDNKLATKFMMVVSNYLPNGLMQEIDRLSHMPIQNPYKTWELE